MKHFLPSWAKAFVVSALALTLALLMSISIVSCGQKGPLYLPQAAQPTADSAVTKSSSASKEKSSATDQASSSAAAPAL